MDPPIECHRRVSSAANGDLTDLDLFGIEELTSILLTLMIGCIYAANAALSVSSLMKNSLTLSFLNLSRIRNSATRLHAWFEKFQEKEV
jgi:hypothetical protein